MRVLLQLDGSGLTLEFDAEVGDSSQPWIDLLPGRNAVLARREAGKFELAIGVRRDSSGEIGDSLHGNTRRPERNLDACYGHSVGAMHDSADVTGIGRQDNVQRSTAAARQVERCFQKVLAAEADGFDVSAWGQGLHLHSINGRGD